MALASEVLLAYEIPEAKKKCGIFQEIVILQINNNTKSLDC